MYYFVFLQVEEKAEEKAEEKVEEPPIEAVEEPVEEAIEPAAAESEVVGELTVGSKVRLVEQDPVYKLRYGEDGKVVSIASNTCEVLFESALVTAKLPAEYLQKGPFKPRASLRTFARVSNFEKQVLLMHLGCNETGDRCLQLPPKDDGLFDECIDVYATLVMWSLNVSMDAGDVRYIPLSLSVAWKMKELGTEEQHIKRGKALRRIAEGAKLVLIPLYAGGHFTVMVVSSDEVRYYESLVEPRKACMDAGNEILKHLGIDLPWRSVRASPQLDIDCGLHVCHYIEDELRNFCGEGRGACGWPSLTRLRGILDYTTRCTKVLNTAAERWVAEEKKAAVKSEDEYKKRAQRAREILKAKGRLEELAAREAEIAKTLASVGASVEPPPLPEGFGVKKAPPAKPDEPPSVEPPLPPPAKEGEEPPEEKGEEQPEEKGEEPPKEAGEEPPKEKGEEPPAAKAEEAGKLYDKAAIEMAMESMTLDDLPEAHRKAVMRVREKGVGVCSKCKWQSGCMNCDPDKAWRYYVRLFDYVDEPIPFEVHWQLERYEFFNRLELGMPTPAGESSKKMVVKGGGFQVE